MLQDFQPYAEFAAQETEEAFVAQFSEPVLVVSTFTQSSRTGTWTKVKSENKEGSDMGGAPFKVATIKKRKGANRFSMITVGRTKDNDVQIRANEISKVHAYLSFDDEGEVVIADAGSTNGTCVRGMSLEPVKDKIKLTSGDDVMFGVINTTYYKPSDFYSFLCSIVGKSL